MADIIEKVRIGMTRAEVISVLGEPDDVSTPSRKYRIPAILKYGDIELHFEDGKAGGLFMAYTERVGPDGDHQSIVLKSFSN